MSRRGWCAICSCNQVPQIDFRPKIWATRTKPAHFVCSRRAHTQVSFSFAGRLSHLDSTHTFPSPKDWEMMGPNTYSTFFLFLLHKNWNFGVLNHVVVFCGVQLVHFLQKEYKKSRRVKGFWEGGNCSGASSPFGLIFWISLSWMDVVWCQGNRSSSKSLMSSCFVFNLVERRAFVPSLFSTLPLFNLLKFY